MIKEYVERALKEDIGYWDITTEALTSEEDFLECYLNTRCDGVLCGKDVFQLVFELLGGVEVEFYFKDGDRIKKGDTIAEIKGSAKSILIGERTALNYIQRMSGVATETARYQDELTGTDVKITDTRKNTPNFRLFEKYAVETGGAKVHRFNLCDCAMLKDNHIKCAGGSIEKAVSKLREKLSHTHKIEVECDTLEQVKKAVDCSVDIIMLDNMNLNQIKEAVKIIDKKAVVEVSGNVTFSNLKDLAQTGVDVISSSAIVAKAPVLDLGLDS